MFRVWTAGVAVVALVGLPACGGENDPAARQADDGRHDCELRQLDDGALTVEDGRSCAGMDLRQVSVGAVDALRMELTVDDDRTDPPVAWGVEAVLHVVPRDEGEPSRRLRLSCEQDRLEASMVVDNGPGQRLEFAESPEPGCRRERAKIFVSVAFEALAVDDVPATGREVEIRVTTVARIPTRAYPRLIDPLDEPVTVEIPAEAEANDDD